MQHFTAVAPVAFYIKTPVSVCTHSRRLLYKYTDSPSATSNDAHTHCFSLFCSLISLNVPSINCLPSRVKCGTLKLFAVLVTLAFVRFLTWHRLLWTNTALLRLNFLRRQISACCSTGSTGFYVLFLSKKLQIYTTSVNIFKKVIV